MLFYLRQTTPFDLNEILRLLELWLSRNNFNLKETERKFAELLNVKGVVFVDSMRSGLQLCLQYYSEKYPEKTEILVPEYTFHSNISAVVNSRLKVKYIPVNSETLEINIDDIRRFINSKTLGVIITHIHGRSYDMKKLERVLNNMGVILFEDCAHSIGQKQLGKYLGTFGVGCFSFGTGKIMTAFGGGAIASNDEELLSFMIAKQRTSSVQKKDYLILVNSILYTLMSNPFLSFFTMKPLLKLFLVFNIQRKNHDKFEIINKRISSIEVPCSYQLALLDYQLKQFKSKAMKLITRRFQIAQTYDIDLGITTNSAQHTFMFQYPIRVKTPNKVVDELWRINIDCQLDYCSYGPTLYKGKGKSNINNTLKDIIYLPTNQYLSKDKQSEVVAIVEKYRL